MSLNFIKLALALVVVLLLNLECYCLNKIVLKSELNDTEKFKNIVEIIKAKGQTSVDLLIHDINDNKALNIKSIQTQKEIDEMELRFRRRDQINQNINNMILEVRKIQMTGCKDFDAVKITYILCTGV